MKKSTIFNFSSWNLSLDCNIFKWDGKVPRSNRIWKINFNYFLSFFPDWWWPVAIHKKASGYFLVYVVIIIVRCLFTNKSTTDEVSCLLTLSKQQQQNSLEVSRICYCWKKTCNCSTIILIILICFRVSFFWNLPLLLCSIITHINCFC